MADTVVETTWGPVEGAWASQGDVLILRSVPFAAAPVGDLRLRAPEVPQPWTEPRDGTRFGPIAPQLPGIMERMWGGEGLRTDEDCLTLNVWTPAADDRRRPVMVWIHGGGFATGSGSTPWYDGRTFVRSSDVVVVTINYRLGALGSLHLSDLAGDSWAGSGNCGILDQVAALEWVRDNIAACGGDPANVTVFGESAGAMSIGTLLGLPAARGLFHKAILQSGACANVSDRARANVIATEVLAQLGIDPGDAGALRRVPVTALLKAQDVVANRHFRTGLAFQPVVDGVVLTQPPLESVASGSAAGIPILCGTTLEEWKLFTLADLGLASLDDAGLRLRAEELLGSRAGDIVAQYRRRRPGATVGDVWTALMTDLAFRVPAVRLLEQQTAVGTPCFSYLFSVRSTAFGGALGSCHGLEIPFVFDALSRPGVSLFTGDIPEGPDVASAMHRAWTAFARHGDPSHDGIGRWPAYDITRRATMEFGPRCQVVDDPLSEQRSIWG